MKLSSESEQYLANLSNILDVDYNDLYDLIRFETGGTFNPFVENKKTGAIGLLQWLPSTIKNTWGIDKKDFLNRYNTQELQIKHAIYDYLRPLKPFVDTQDLYMSVFYPKYRKVPQVTPFPEIVKKYNPGINNPGDYIRKVKGSNNNLIFLIGGVLCLVIVLVKMKR